MHTHSTAPWEHSHVFLGEKHEHHERRTWLVVALTAATMVVEVVGGTIFGSMAVVADGVHMSTRFRSRRSPIGLRAATRGMHGSHSEPARSEILRASRAPCFLP